MADPLPEETIVIRGGTNPPDKMREQAQEEFDDCGVYSLSAAADPAMTLEEIARTARRPNAQIVQTTVGRLRSAGCDVTHPTGKRRHVDILLPQPPTEEDWQALEEASDPPEPNPYRRGGAT